VIIAGASVAPSLSTVTEAAAPKPGMLILSGTNGYLIVRLNNTLRAVTLSSGAMVEFKDIARPIVFVTKWSIVRAVPYGPPRSIFLAGDKEFH
jgi:hypothetical protein